MNHYRITFAARLGFSSTLLLRSAQTITDVTTRFAPWIASGWILTVERVV